MSKNEEYMMDDFDVKSSLPDADSHDGDYYQRTTNNGNTFTFKKLTDTKPYGWQQVANRNYPSDEREETVKK